MQNSISIGQSFLLGIVQGLTEFLPVSSSGHLVLFRSYFNIDDVGLLFDVLLHVATLVVIVFYYRKLVGSLFLSFFRFIARKSGLEDKENLNLIVGIIISTLITVAMALIFKALKIEATDKLSVSILMLVTALLLFSTRYVNKVVKPTDKLGPKQIIMSGFGQGFGVLAGISRSGATLTAALYSGMERKKAADYTFILSIPAVLGALVLTLAEKGESVTISISAMLVGCFAAFVVGMLTLRVLLWMIKSARLWYFSIYLLIVGVFGIVSAFV